MKHLVQRFKFNKRNWQPGEGVVSQVVELSGLLSAPLLPGRMSHPPICGGLLISLLLGHTMNSLRFFFFSFYTSVCLFFLDCNLMSYTHSSWIQELNDAEKMVD